MRAKSRAALSQIATAVIAAVIVVGILAGTFLTLGAFPAAASSTSVSTSSVSSSSGASTHTTSSQTQIANHTTSSHSGTMTSTAVTGTSSATSSGTAVGPPPVVKFLFGAPVRDNATTENIPANTLIWTSWIVNSSATLSAQVSIGVLTKYVNSSFGVAIYINGVLAGNGTITLYPSGGPGFSSGFLNEAAAVGIPNSMQPVPVGSVISFAVLAPIPLEPYFDTGIGVQTNEASVNTSSGFPQQLPQSTSTISSTLQMWAYTEEEG